MSESLKCLKQNEDQDHDQHSKDSCCRCHAQLGAGSPRFRNTIWLWPCACSECSRAVTGCSNESYLCAQCYSHCQTDLWEEDLNQFQDIGGCESTDDDRSGQLSPEPSEYELEFDYGFAGAEPQFPEAPPASINSVRASDVRAKQRPNFIYLARYKPVVITPIPYSVV